MDVSNQSSNQKIAEHTTQVKKALFLAAYRDVGTIRHAAEAAGIERRSVYLWQEHDQEFSLALQQAKLDAIEALEKEAHRRAVIGTVKEKGIYHNGEQVATEIIREYSDTLLIFLLKGSAPDKYRDNVNVTQTQVTKLMDREFFEAV